MKFIVSAALCTIVDGPLRLSPQQIDARRHAIELLDEETGECNPLTPLTFKHGEELDLPFKAGDLPSPLDAVLVPKPRSKNKAHSRENAAAVLPGAGDIGGQDEPDDGDATGDDLNPAAGV